MIIANRIVLGILSVILFLQFSIITFWLVIFDNYNLLGPYQEILDAMLSQPVTDNISATVGSSLTIGLWLAVFASFGFFIFSLFAYKNIKIALVFGMSLLFVNVAEILWHQYDLISFGHLRYDLIAPSVILIITSLSINKNSTTKLNGNTT